MEEPYELRNYLEAGKPKEALTLLDEMEEMSRDDKINRIANFMEILLIHLIKQAVEKRTTRFWDVSIRNALRRIDKINKRRKTGGWYLTEDELSTALEESFESALDNAALEILDGRHSPEEVAIMIDRSELLRLALHKIHAGR
jgi:DNA primase large subunit